MAATFTKYVPDSIPVYGDIEIWLGKVTFDSSYPTGGELVTAADFGGDDILFVQVSAISDVATKHVRWIRSTNALQIMVEDGTSGISAEAANASDQSAVDAELLVFVRNR
jgi:hypothetical protein